MKLLHIDSSIQADASASRVISKAVVERLCSVDTLLSVTYRDLAAAPLAHLTLGAFAEEQSQEILAEFQAADIVVIGAGLYNFSIPSQLKAWIDRILVAGKTFRYGENGPEGVSAGKRIIVALARGGVYSNGSPLAGFEHAETLLRNVFSFIGIPAPEFIIAEGLALGEDARQASVEGAIKQAGLIDVPLSSV